MYLLKKNARFICLMEIFMRNKFQSIQINFHERKKSSENIRIWLQARKTRNRGEICSNQMIQTVSTKSNGTELNQNKNVSCSILVGVKKSTKNGENPKLFITLLTTKIHFCTKKNRATIEAETKLETIGKNVFKYTHIQMQKISPFAIFDTTAEKELLHSITIAITRLN